MDKLISFLLRYQAFFLFLILEVVCLGLIFRKNDYQRSVFMGATSSVSGGIYSGINNLEDYFQLIEVNDSLGKENARLKALLKSYELLDSNKFVPIFDTSKNELIYRACYAKVINYTVNREDNFILLNKGMKNGVAPQMGLISDHGVVGIVKDASYHYAAAYSILNTKRSVGAKLKKSNHLGSITWTRGSHQYVQLNNISDYVNVQKGDTVVTSGNSEIFPEGELIGFIDEIEKAERPGFYIIKVKLSANLKELDHVYVVENKKVKELKDLKLDKDDDE